MIPSLTTFLKTVTGKAVAGLLVASTGVGAAAAAGTEMALPFQAPDEPAAEVVSEEPAIEPEEEPAEEPAIEPAEEPAVEPAEQPAVEPAEGPAEDVQDGDEQNHGVVVSAFTQSTDLEGCAKGQATAAVARGDVDPDSETLDEDLAPYVEKCAADEDDADEDEQDGEERDNHGAVVSDFVHSTDLEGCAKGQATAAVARGDVDPDSETLDDDLAEYTGTCDRTDESVPEATDDDGDDTAKRRDKSQENGHGNGNGYGNGHGNGHGNGKPHG